MSIDQSMTGSISSWVTVVLFLISVYGWGRLSKLLRNARISRFHSLSLILGFAFLNAVGGLLNLFGWATALTLLGLESLEDYLRKWNIRYVMVESDPRGAKNSNFLRSMIEWDDVWYKEWGEFNLYFRESLFDLARRHHVIHQDDRMLLFELDEAPNPAKSVPAHR